ncbi:MAG: cysteine desulfurase family protein [Bacteroidota bacterium]
MGRIFLDNSATTPLDPRVIEAMTECMQNTNGNPSSIHAEGRTARAAIEAARKTVATSLNAGIGEIFFTSGGTEANNMALKNAVRDLGVQRIISSPLEHHCVLHSLDRIAADSGIEIEMVDVDAKGRVQIDHLRKSLQKDARKTLVSLMHANNEIGTLLPLQEVADLCQEHGALFHCDTVQTIGYYPIDLEKTPISFLSGSGHKLYGPKGVGFIYINNENIVKPYLDGGAQERNMRGGTENSYGIVGLAKAIELANEELDPRRVHISSLKDHFVNRLRRDIEDIRFNGDIDNGHFKVISVSMPEMSTGDLLLMNLDMAGIAASGGSACSSGIDTGSHVIAHLYPDDPRPTVRFSLSHHNTVEQIDRVVDVLAELVAKGRSVMA